MHIGAHRDEPRGGAPVNHAAYNWFCECGCGAVGAAEPPRRCPQCGRRVWAAEWCRSIERYPCGDEPRRLAVNWISRP